MSPSSALGLDTGRAGQVTFVAVVAHGLVADALHRGEAWDSWAAAFWFGVNAVYLGLGMFAPPVVARIGLLGHCLVLNALAAMIVVWSEGAALIAPMPIVALLVPIVRRAAVALVVALYAALLAAVLEHPLAASDTIATVGAFVTGAVFVMAFTEIAMRERLARAALTEAHRRLAEYGSQAEELAAARERNRLARELHDSLGHYLTVIHVQLEAAGSHLETDVYRSRQALGKAARLTREGLEDVRRSVGMLRGPALRSGDLIGGLQMLIDETTAAGIRTELVLRGARRALPPAGELVLYRAAQEGLTNVRKHSRAKEARVEVVFETDEVRLSIRDNGSGPGAIAGLGFGLQGIRERAELIGGSVRIDTHDGFALTMTLPL